MFKYCITSTNRTGLEVYVKYCFYQKYIMLNKHIKWVHVYFKIQHVIKIHMEISIWS